MTLIIFIPIIAFERITMLHGLLTSTGTLYRLYLCLYRLISLVPPNNGVTSNVRPGWRPVGARIVGLSRMESATRVSSTTVRRIYRERI